MKYFFMAMPGGGNLGDDLISVVLANEIFKQDPDAEIGIINEVTTNKFAYKKPGQIVIFTRPSIKDFCHYFSKRNAIRDFIVDSDFIIVGGGGLFQDSHFNYTIHFFLKYVIKYAPAKSRILGLGLGVGPVRTYSNINYLKEYINIFDYIEVRDVESAELLSRLTGVEAKVTLDLVEGLPLLDIFMEEKSEQSDNVLGCSIRPWKNLVIEDVVKMIVDIVAFYHCGVRLFVFEHLGNNNEEFVFAQKLAEKLKLRGIDSEIVSYETHSIEVFVNLFTKVRLAVAVRYHANILWQKLGVPTLPISYAPKIDSLYGKNGVKVYKVDDLKKVVIDKDSFKVLHFDSYTFPKLGNLEFRRKFNRNAFTNLYMDYLSGKAYNVLIKRFLFSKIQNN